MPRGRVRAATWAAAVAGWLAAGLPLPAVAAGVDDCMFHGIALSGKVQVVPAFADARVAIVQAFPDLKVVVVPAFADDCGEWELVDAFPDFTIQIVEHFPDFTVQFVMAFPGT